MSFQSDQALLPILQNSDNSDTSQSEFFIQGSFIIHTCTLSSDHGLVVAVITSLGISDIITYRAKLLNVDWLRQRAFFLNFPSMEGKITRF